MILVRVDQREEWKRSVERAHEVRHGGMDLPLSEQRRLGYGRVNGESLEKSWSNTTIRGCIIYLKLNPQRIKEMMGYTPKELEDPVGWKIVQLNLMMDSLVEALVTWQRFGGVARVYSDGSRVSTKVQRLAGKRSSTCWEEEKTSRESWTAKKSSSHFQESLARGDMVLICESSQIKNEYKLAKVIGVEGTDG